MLGCRNKGLPFRCLLDVVPFILVQLCPCWSTCLTKQALFLGCWGCFWQLKVYQRPRTINQKSGDKCALECRGQHDDHHAMVGKCENRSIDLSSMLSLFVMSKLNHYCALHFSTWYWTREEKMLLTFVNVISTISFAFGVSIQKKFKKFKERCWLCTRQCACIVRIYFYIWRVCFFLDSFRFMNHSLLRKNSSSIEAVDIACIPVHFQIWFM